MPACQLVTQQRRGRSEIQLTGTFDGPAAWELAKRLTSERSDVVLDFGRVDTFFDFGLNVLAHALQEANRPVLLVGLRHHQLRLLRYLGVEVSDAGVVGACPAAILPMAALAVG